MSGLEIIALATRLIAITVAVLLLPGLLATKAMRVEAEWPERTVLAFALSYSWMFLLSILVPAFGWSVDVAAALTVALIAALTIAAFRRRAPGDPGAERESTGGSGVLLAATVVLAAVCGWVIEPAITGEEALDLASIGRIADGGAITFTNTSLFPDTTAVYVFQPYQLAVGMIARWSGTDPLIAYIKLRAVLAPLALVFMYALLRRLTPTRVDATAAFVVVLLFMSLDVGTWELNSLFPLVRRGGVGAGLCVPALIVLCLVATRRAGTPAARMARRVAIAVAPVMLAASLATHPLEMFTLLCFAGAIVAAALARLDPLADRRLALTLIALLTTVALGYVALQSRAVPYVAEYERDDKQSLRMELARLLSDPPGALMGQPTEARDLLTRTIPATTATVVGIPAMAFAALRAPATSAMLALGFVPLALLYASPAGYIVLTLLTSVETVRDVNAYFALLGLVAVAIAVTASAHAILNAAAWPHRRFTDVIAAALAGSVVLWIAWSGGRTAIQAFVAGAAARPEVALLVASVTAAIVLVMARARPWPVVRTAPFASGVVLLTACLAIPLAVPDRVLGGAFARREPVTLWARFNSALAAPSVLDWPAFYGSLARSIAPPLPVPRAVVDELRRVLPPREVLLADPRYSCALVVLVNAYCVNPESIYGHYFQPAASYFREYVRGDNGAEPEHPIFNATAEPSDAEYALLADYPGAYVLVGPEHRDVASRKLQEAGATLEMDLDGYRLFRLGAPGARTGAR